MTADFLSKMSGLRQDAVFIYTDGSKEPGIAVGAGVYSSALDFAIEHKLPRETSIFSAELWTIFQATFFAKDCENKNIIIFSDSKSALDAINYNRLQYPE